VLLRRVLGLIVTMIAIDMKTATGSIATGIATFIGATATTTTSTVTRAQL
jgi:hypothetical protein